MQKVTHYLDKNGFPEPLPLNSMIDKSGLPVFVGTRIVHPNYGTGEIIDITKDGKYCQIIFDNNIQAQVFCKYEITDFEKV